VKLRAGLTFSALLNLSASLAIAQAPDVPPAPGGPERVAPEAPASTLDAERDAEARKAVSGFVAPEAPALTALGAATATIERPGNTTEVGVSLANLVSAEGTVRSGVALELTPRALGYEPTTSAYVNDYSARLLSRLAFSIATVSETQPGAQSPKSAVRLGFGVRLALWDESDPYLLASYVAAVDDARAACEAIDKLVLGEWERCLAREYVKRASFAPAWNGGGFVLALAQTLRFDQARFKRGEAEATQAFAALALRVQRWGQLNLAAAYVQRYAPSASDLIAAVRGRFGGESFRGTAELSAYFTDLGEAAHQQLKAALGFEVRVARGLWLQASVGGDLDDGALFSIGNLKWDTLDEPSFALD